MITKEFFGIHAGQDIYLYTVTGKRMSMQISTLGGTIVSLFVPDREGTPRNVLLGYDDLEGFVGGVKFLNSTIGRFANRIAGGRFTLMGRTYQLFCNEKSGSLHGGVGFHTRVWDAEAQGEKLVLSYLSPDGEAGYPANLKAQVSFYFDDDCGLHIDYFALPDAPTICSMTNHAYFNFLDGRENMLSHELFINADRYTVTGPGLIPVSDEPVSNTPFDFRTPKKIEQAIYDHNYVLNGGSGAQASLYESTTGIFMEVFTDRPCIQFYSSKWMTEHTGRHGYTYGLGHGVCLETQLPPNCPNTQGCTEHIITPEKPFKSSTVYRFSVK